MSTYNRVPTMSWKSPVPQAADLPLSGNIDGDARIVLATDTLYVWHNADSSWIAIASPGEAIAIDGLTGDVSASGPGVVVATVNVVGGSLAAAVSTATVLANNATSANTASQIVKRDSSGNFVANDVTVDNLFANEKIGIGTTSPSYLLSLAGDGGIFAAGTFGSGTAVADTGAGSRMVWNPRKAAFRAGEVSGTQWDNAQVGTHSLAVGQDNIASGDQSVAMGSGNIASGPSTISLGGGNTASSTASIAIGYQLNSTGVASVALGNSSIASGNNSLALSNGTSSGGNSMAMGPGTVSLGGVSVALGYNARSSAYLQTVFGRSNLETGTENPSAWIATDPLFTVGNGDVGTESNALMILKNGFVGIGTDAPSTSLTVKGDIATLNGSDIGSNIIYGNGNSLLALDPSARIQIGSNAVGVARVNIQGLGNDGTTQSLHVINSDGDFVFTALDDGRVGIGTDTPSELLHVLGDASSDAVIAIIENSSATNPKTSIVLSNSGAGTDWQLINSGNDANELNFVHNGDAPTLSLSTAGNVGISNNYPSARLDLPAGTTAAGTAPLKINSGTLMTSEEEGAIESDGTHLYWTDDNGDRQQLDGGAGSGANTSLSNLSSVAINQDMLPDDTIVYNIGSDSLNWDTLFAAAIQYGNVGDDLNISTISAPEDSNSGNIEIETGSVSGTGVQGNIVLTASVIDIVGGHINITQTPAPSTVAQAAAGAGASSSALTDSTDVCGIIELVSGVGLSTGTQVVVTFNKTFDTTPFVVLTPANAITAVASIYVTATGSTFTISAAVALTLSSTYRWNYHVISGVNP